MDVLANGVTARPVLAIGALVLLLGLEWWGPFRLPVQPKLRHTATNLLIVGSNGVVVSLLFGGSLLLLSRHVEAEAWGLLPQLGLGSLLNLMASVILLDLIFYGAHWANHHIPFLWRLHRAHHSDLDLDVTTAFRFHIGEVLISTGIKAASVVALGVAPLGLIAFEMALLTAAQFQHSNLRLPEPLETWARFLTVTPNMHRVHHSTRPRDHNSNFGTILSSWDRLFRTYFMEVQQEEIKIGLDQYSSPQQVGLGRFLVMPWGAPCQGGALGASHSSR